MKNKKSAGDTYMFRYACFDMLTQRNLTEQDASAKASDLTVMYMTERSLSRRVRVRVALSDKSNPIFRAVIILLRVFYLKIPTGARERACQRMA